ncbi:dTMP kinase [Candidatus Pacearchaeota archaeon RBG_13_36_9]|nr:MAG: dTMP kinase [Candidatus Pacearchaeota archaeon RBG_13_36_9]
MQNKGTFIVFEGIDGCGKSTQIMKFVEHLSKLSKYNHILLTRNPYKARETREILKINDAPESQAEKLAELFVNDRIEQTKEIILPHLEKGHYVVSDRYKLSTIAYQSAQGMPVEKLKQMHEGMPIPDITFIVDVPAEIGGERMDKDNRDKHRLKASTEFQEKVRQKYLESVKHLPDEKIFIIDGTKSVEEIHKQITEEFEKLNILKDIKC